ncbi:MAG: nucleotidyltransferase domain-containing protein [Deltaproteobacteria bacterium]|nr:nucleotidyltransferase domain-containing protein [Deltaproteobacteria bacterium]
MPKIPKDPKEILEAFSADYQALFGENLVSIILYGSAAADGYRPGKSDINFMVVLTEEGINDLERALPLVEKWKKRNVAVPLFLTQNYIRTSTDVFPVEYLGFHRRHHLVYGKDLLSDLSFDPQWVRLQCEREIKGKLLLLREAYFQAGGKARGLRELIAQSIRAFTAIFEALLFLKNIEVPPKGRDTVKLACEAFGLDAALFDKLLDIREERLKPSGEEVQKLFKRYLHEVRKLAQAVDSMGG